VIEQVTYPLFIEQLHDLQSRAENKANATPLQNPVFSRGTDDSSRRMGEAGSSFATNRKDARFTTSIPALLSRVVDLLEDIPMDDCDALLVGLTATPKNKIDHNTHGLFALEDGVPTDCYALSDAIAESYLVPPVGTSVAAQFVRQGSRYDDLSEKEQWDLKDWGDDDGPDEINSHTANTWLVNANANANAVDKVLVTLMSEGRRVAGGDTLAKTIGLRAAGITPTSSTNGATPIIRSTRETSPG